MMNKAGGARFAFLDAGETARRLGIDRVTLDQWIRDGRIKAYKGVGRDSFFKTSEVDALYSELHPAAELAAAVAEDERETAATQAGAAGQSIQLTPRRKQHDPQMKVYLRLQADAKWFDITEEDISTWFKQLSPEGYERNKRNVEHTIKKLQYLVDLIDDGQKRMSKGE